MRTPLDDLPLLQCADQVGVADRAEAVGDDDGCTSLEQTVKGFLDQCLRNGINAGRRLIQNQDTWVGKDGSCNTDQLALSH